MTQTRQSIHRLVLRQRRSAVLLAVACLLLSLVVPTSCVEPLTPEQKLDYLSKDLTLRFYLPGNGIATKAVPGNVESINPESRIYNVQVWAFNHADPSATGEALAAIDAETAVAYTEAYNIAWNNSSQLPNGSNYYAETYWDGAYTLEVPMRIPGYILDRPAADMKFDFYVLANASSVSRTVAINATRKQIKEASFGYTSATSDPFGPNGPKYGPTPIAAINGGASTGPGLPISGFFNKDKTGAATGVDLSFLQGSNYASMTPAQVHEQLPIVQLERAVSKLRFVFCAPVGMTDHSITRIEVDDGMIPNQTYLFPREGDVTRFELPQGVSYSAYTTSITAPATIGTLPDPNYLRSRCDSSALKFVSEDRIYDGETPKEMTAQQYSLYLDDAVAKNHASQTLVYLRESGKPITGKIYYRVPGMAESDPDLVATFDMTKVPGYDAATTTTNFHRNHYWIVYSYFKSGKLFVNPTVADWIDTDPLTYKLKMSSNMRLFDSWLYRYDLDGNYDDWLTNWVGSYMAVSEGRDASGRPLRSPQIQLVTTGEYPFSLKVDNPEFEIVRANKNTAGVVTSYDASDDNGVLTIREGDDVYTYFYIVPKDGVTHSNPVAKVTLIYNDSLLGQQKVTFNYGSLPGYSDDSSEIWAYYVPESNYNITGKLKMYFQDYNHPLVRTDVQN